MDGHLDGTKVPLGADDKAWTKVDTLIKMLIYNNVSAPILQMIMKKNLTACQVWKNLDNLFQSNNSAKAMQLHEDLCNIEIANLTVSEYCHKLKVIFDLLQNIDEEALVMHIVNGLSEK